MAATALVAARVEPELKERVKQVLSDNHMTETDLIRGVWSYIDREGCIPEALFGKQASMEYDSGKPKRDRFDDMVDWMKDGPLSSFDWSSFTDEALDQALTERWS